jgi:hypothetical protein
VGVDERSDYFKAQLGALSLGTFTDPARANTLRARAHAAQGRRVATPERLPIECHPDSDGGDCGMVFLLPPSRYWAVKTAELVGDFTHEMYHIYDPRAGEYFLPDSPNERARTPLKRSDWELRRQTSLNVSPDGKWLMEYGRILSLEGTTPAIPIGAACGWLENAPLPLAPKCRSPFCKRFPWDEALER